jgi:hypothetical protein
MVPATYFAAWRSFDCHRIATAAAAFLATNIPSIHFSRHIMNIDPWGVFAGCLFFLAHGMRVYAAWALGAAGLLVAFALHLYLSGRVLCFVIPLFFVLILRHRERWKASLWFGILLFIIGSFVFFGPNVVDIWVNTEAWKGSNRPYSTFLLIRNFYDYARSNHIQTIPEFISSRLWTVLLLIYSRDTSGQTPLGFSFFFNLAITPLFWLGLGVSLFEAKRNPIQLLMSILLLLTMGLGIAIAPVGTYWPKVLCLTLIGAIFIARSGVCVLQACVNIFMPELGQKPVTQARVSRLGVIVSQLFIVGVFTVLGIQNWSLYRVAAARDDFIASALGWYAASLPQGTKVCLAGDQTTHIHLNELPVLFLANKQILRPLASKNSEELFAECGAAPFVWILSNNQSALQEALKQAFPRGKLEDHAGDTGGRLFLSFTVPS